MKTFKTTLLIALLVLGTFGMVAGSAVAAAGFDCEGAGDDCTIEFERDDGSEVSISGAKVVVT